MQNPYHKYNLQIGHKAVLTGSERPCGCGAEAGGGGGIGRAWLAASRSSAVVYHHSNAYKQDNPSIVRTKFMLVVKAVSKQHFGAQRFQLLICCFWPKDLSIVGACLECEDCHDQ